MTTIGEFFDLLWKSEKGRVCVCNFVDCHTKKITDGVVTKAFANSWLKTYSSLGGRGDPLDIIETVTTKKSGDEFLFLRKSNLNPDLTGYRLLTVIDSKYLKNQLSATSQQHLRTLFDEITKFKPSLGLTRMRDLEQEIFKIGKLLSTVGDRDGLINVSFGDTIRGDTRPVWLSTFGFGAIEDQIWQDESHWCDRADIARDKLGLIHQGGSGKSTSKFQPVLLAAIVVPFDSIPAGTRYVRPTLMDAGRHSRFKGVFGDLRKRPDDWGRAVDLAKILLPRPHRAGREIVAENFRPGKPAKVAILGFTRVPRNDYLGVHDKEFMTLIQRSRSEKGIKEQFLSICH